MNDGRAQNLARPPRPDPGRARSAASCSIRWRPLMTMAVIAVALALPLFLQRAPAEHARRHRQLEPGVRLVGLSRQEGRNRARRGARRSSCAPAPDVARGARHHRRAGTRGVSRHVSGFGKALDALDRQPAAEHAGRHARRSAASTPEGTLALKTQHRGACRRGHGAARHRVGAAPERDARRLAAGRLAHRRAAWRSASCWWWATPSASIF